MPDFDSKKLCDIIDSLLEFLNEGEEQYQIKDIETFKTVNPMALGPAPFAFVTTIFKMADKYRFTEEEFGFAIAMLQCEFGQITGTVPIDEDVFKFVNEGEDIEGPLADTIDGMVSDDYKERFVAEYRQLCYRRNRLADMLEKVHEGTLDFKPTCPIELLQDQLDSMSCYKNVLESRAHHEGIDLTMKEA